MTIYFLPAPYHALRGNVFFDALRPGGTIGGTIGGIISGSDTDFKIKILASQREEIALKCIDER